MSTDAQLKGDSLRRQLENSSRFVTEHDLELVEDLRDLGVSAFRGANVEYGALGKFIQAVRNGHIETGSYLIVEAFDRISRQPPRIALGLILDLINSGITVVTMHNRQAYSSENFESQQLFISIIEMSTAAEESAKKSQRVTAAWHSKRNKIDSGKLTSRGPAWLKYSADTKQFEPLPERVEVIRRIFDEAIAGIGAFTIAKRLNEAALPTFGSWSSSAIEQIIERREKTAKNRRPKPVRESVDVIKRILEESLEGVGIDIIARRLNDDRVPTFTSWNPSSVNKIIAGRAVIGEFQLHRDEGGKRVAVGEPVKGYFPAVVTDEIYYSAQAARLGRKTTGGGRKGPYLSNLFAKLIYCYYCGARMLFEDKGDGPKGNTYFVCMSVPTGSDCVRTRWRYDDFEASFLAFVQQVDLGSIFSAEKDAAKRAALEAEMTSLRGERLVLMEKRDKVFELSLDRDINVDYLAG
jgi:DNA invertase Pin-like site-specific DNA recombinase